MPMSDKASVYGPLKVDPYRDSPKGGAGGDNQGFWFVVFVALFAAVMWVAETIGEDNSVSDPNYEPVYELDYGAP